MNGLTPRDPQFEARVRASFERQAFMREIGARIATLAPGFCEIHLPFRPGLGQQHGYFHGGIIGTLADNASGYASYTLMAAADSVLTVEYKLNIVAPGDGEALIARGQVHRSGRTLTVGRSDVFAIKDGRETLVATMLGTFMRLADTADRPKDKAA